MMPRAKRASTRQRGRMTLGLLVFVFAGLAAVTWWVNREPVTYDPADYGIPNAYPLFNGLDVAQIVGVRLWNPANGNALVVSRSPGAAWVLRDETLVEITLESDPNAAVTDLATATAYALLTPSPSASDAELIARTAAILPYLETIPPPTDGSTRDLRAFGYFPQGLFGIDVSLADGTAHTIEIGDITPSREAYYARVDDRPDLYLIPHAPIDYLITTFRRR